MARVRAVEGTRVLPLASGWRVAAALPESLANPDALGNAMLDWCDATVPATAASALRAAGKWSIDDRRDFDAVDWWWRREVTSEAASPGAPSFLLIGGLATVAEVWLNGARVLSSRNMFVEHEIPLTALRPGANDLVVCCRAVATALRERR